MDPTGFRHRRSASSSDRLLGVFTLSTPPNAAAADELNEAELFWAGDFPEPENQRPVSPHKNRRPSFDHPGNSGILAILTKPDARFGDQSVLSRKPSVSSSSSKMIPAIPRPLLSQNSGDREFFSQSMPSRKFQQSAPVEVPMLSAKAMAQRRNGGFDFVDDDVDDDDEMLPPHELVTRGSGVSPKTTFSVLEGVGRTLKGRDLRQVRNAIWRKTGFLD